eukprot:1474997-Rhodomonas_salina.2
MCGTEGCAVLRERITGPGHPGRKVMVRASHRSAQSLKTAKSNTNSRLVSTICTVLALDSLYFAIPGTGMAGLAICLRDSQY